jgi:hypothetical protein
MWTGAEQTEDEDSKAKQQKAAYLAAAFDLPRRGCRSLLLWHGLEVVG